MANNAASWIVRQLRWLRDRPSFVGLLLAVAASVFMGIGILVDFVTAKHSEAAQTQSVLFVVIDQISATVYETAQLFLLNTDPRPGRNWFITIGRLFAVALAAALGYQALRKLFGDTWYTLRLFRYRDHTVVCGLGHIGNAVAQQLLVKDQSVVVIERDARNDRIEPARQAKAIVLRGDANDTWMRSLAELGRAKQVVIAVGNDADTLAIASAVVGPAGRAECHVHLLDPDLRHLIRGTHWRAFNFDLATARRLIAERLTAYRPTSTAEVALYVVVGFEAMGEALLGQLAGLAHFENFKRSRIVVLAADPERAADRALARWGQLSPRRVVAHWADLKFDHAADDWSYRGDRPEHHAYRIEHPDAVEYAANVVFAPLPAHFADRAMLDPLVGLFGAGVKPAIIVTLAGEAECATVATTLGRQLTDIHARPDVPVYAWVPRHEPIHDLLTIAGRVTPFGLCRTEFAINDIFDPLDEYLAELIHRQYAARNENTLPWKELPDLHRQSNIDAGFHALIKLTWLGVLTRGKLSARLPELTDDQKLTLANMEHNRWMAERLLGGTTYGSRSDLPPRRTSMVVSERLEGRELQKDLDQVTDVFHALRELGW